MHPSDQLIHLEDVMCILPCETLELSARKFFMRATLVIRLKL